MTAARGFLPPAVAALALGRRRAAPPARPARRPPMRANPGPSDPPAPAWAVDRETFASASYAGAARRLARAVFAPGLLRLTTLAAVAPERLRPAFASRPPAVVVVGPGPGAPPAFGAGDWVRLARADAPGARPVAAADLVMDPEGGLLYAPRAWSAPGASDLHRAVVERAAAQGLDVPASVRALYPAA